jgi:hypothetical protein
LRSQVFARSNSAGVIVPALRILGWINNQIHELVATLAPLILKVMS